MTLTFRAEQEFFTFLDPAGKPLERKTEVRFDPLTGETSRLVYDPGAGAPFTPPSYEEAAKATEGSKCPFCPDNVHTMTPTFSNEIVEGGRLVKGEAVAFPNLFPYGKHNAVVRMTDSHYVRLEEFSIPVLADALSVAHAYLSKVLQTDPKATHASINWNYLPPSGGSILHPHIHVLASEQQTRYQATVSEYGQAFYEKYKQPYYQALLEEERRLQQRWVGQQDTLGWVHAYAPRSHYDFVGIYEDAPSFAELDERHWLALAESLLRFFRFFREAGIASFNLAAFIPVRRTEASGVHIRLIPRLTTGLLATSDMNVFNFVHGEYLSLRTPETTSKEAAAFFL